MAGKDTEFAEDHEHFRFINEKPVDDISLEFFYQPHTITLLTLSILGLVYSAFTRNDSISEDNVWNGFCCVLFFFLIISVLAFPNGPFTRPHPAVWRIVFGISVVYLLFLLFGIFQNFQDVKRMIYWFYPQLASQDPDMKLYAQNCSDVSFAIMWSHLDIFALGHFLGWIVKALLIRHYGICWAISVTWEVTEGLFGLVVMIQEEGSIWMFSIQVEYWVVFSHLLPNFAECWWDAWILDVLVCNGLGIFVGLNICKKLELTNFHWESIKDIHSTTGKIRRAVLQFTPASWTHVRWLDPNSTYMRLIAVYMLIVFWQVAELNTFLLKHIFNVPTPHPLNLFRLFLISVVSAPSVRQFYCYVTDTRCKRVGTQCWVFCAITLSEAILCVKFAPKLFKETKYTYILYWLMVQMVCTTVCVYVCVKFAMRWPQWKIQNFDDLIVSLDRRDKQNKSDQDNHKVNTHSVNGEILNHHHHHDSDYPTSDSQSLKDHMNNASGPHKNNEPGSNGQLIRKRVKNVSANGHL